MATAEGFLANMQYGAVQSPADESHHDKDQKGKASHFSGCFRDAFWVIEMIGNKLGSALVTVPENMLALAKFKSMTLTNLLQPVGFFQQAVR